MGPTAHSVLGPSKGELIVHCPPSFRLSEGIEEEASEYALSGTAAHELAEYKGRKIESAADAAAILIEDYHVVIVPCADFGAPECFRLSYAISDDDIRKGLGRLKTFLDDLK